MMNRLKIQILLLANLFFAIIHSQELPERPNTLVSDELGFFTPSEKALLEQKLVDFDNSTSTQIAITTISSLQGYDIDDLSQRILEKWGVGKAGKNNGILILIKPKTPSERGEISISIGYGLEGVIPDAIAKRIIEVEVIPNFKNGEYYKGIDAATNTLMSLALEEFSADEYLERTGKDKSVNVVGIFVIIVFGIVIFSAIYGNKRRGYSSIGHRTSFWYGAGYGSSIGRSGGFGGFSSGSGGFGGFGGGFGGGGGASGAW